MSEVLLCSGIEQRLLEMESCDFVDRHFSIIVAQLCPPIMIVWRDLINDESLGVETEQWSTYYEHRLPK